MSDDSLRKEAGPLFTALLAAQRREQELVSYPTIGQIADAVVAAARAAGDCLIWPADAAAERVAGAVALRSRGTTVIAAPNTSVAGRNVLLLAIVAVSP